MPLKKGNKIIMADHNIKYKMLKITHFGEYITSVTQEQSKSKNAVLNKRITSLPVQNSGSNQNRSFCTYCTAVFKMTKMYCEYDSALRQLK